MSILIATILTIINIAYFYYIGINNTAYLIPACINCFLTLKAMFSESDKPFTLYKMVNLFVYVFFVLANAVQLSNHNNVLTFHLTLNESDFVNFQILVLIILLVFNFVYYYVGNSTSQRLKKSRYFNYTFFDNRLNPKTLLLLATLGWLAVWTYYRFNIPMLMFRGEAVSRVAELQVSKSSNLLMQNFIRPIPFACFMICMLSKTKRRYCIYTFVLTLLTVFPTGMPRNAAAMYWIPIMCLCISKYLKNNVFMWTMITGLFVVFPFLSQFRSVSNYDDSKFSWSMDFLNQMDFDASQIFIASMKTELITFGHQLLGALLFFVPRSIWISKPGGSGALLVREQNGYWTNVAMPFFSEGYVNFGLFGILIFTVFIGWLCAKLDVIYWNKWMKNNNYLTGIYLIFLGAIIFIMRGDMMSSTAYTVGIMVSYAFCLVLCSNYRIVKFVWK